MPGSRQALPVKRAAAYLLLRLEERLLPPLDLALVLLLLALARPPEDDDLLPLLPDLLLPPLDAEARLDDGDDFEDEEELRDAIACTPCGSRAAHARAGPRPNLGGWREGAVGAIGIPL